MSSQQNDSYLKSLSKKQYSWMQPASSPTSDIVPSLDTDVQTQNSSMHSTAKDVAKLQEPEPEPVAVTEPEAPLNEPMDISEDVEINKISQDQTATGQNGNVESVRPREMKSKSANNPRFKYTSFPVKGFNILPTRNITSQYAKADTLNTQSILTGPDDIKPNPETEGSDVIIIHPGSRNLRIGRASEAFPRTVPHVIARKMNTSATESMSNSPPQVLSMDMDISQDTLEDDVEADVDAADTELPVRKTDTSQMTPLQVSALEAIEGTLKYRMKIAKRRAVPNANAQVISYNSQAVQEIIPDHNDPYKVEWTDADHEGRPEYFIGEKALNLPLNSNPGYRLLHPMKYGELNTHDYSSIQQVIGDLQVIWTESIRSELDIEDKDFRNYNAILVIPDVYNRTYVAEMVTMLLRYMNFRGVFVQQESTCATFGAGISMACVVDIGAQKTSISCVEDGLCLPDSRITLPLGGDDITTSFTSFLKRNKFPYASPDLSRSYDWKLFESLKEKWCTINEADISVQVYDFFVREPEKPTRKFQCKVYEEVYLAPLCLIFPGILEKDQKPMVVQTWNSENVIDDITDESAAVNTATQPQQSATALASTKSKPSTPLPPGLSPVVKPLTAPSTPAADSEQAGSPAPADIDEPTPTQSNAVTSESSMTPEKSEEVYIPTPIDTAVAQSIHSAASTSEERLKKFFTSIILVGGGGMITNLDRLLEDCIHNTAIARKCGVEKVEILPAPRELDPRLLVWKGAYVLSKLESTNDMWIGEKEWNEVGVRCLRDRMLFVW
ncbi:Actin-like protein arp8 [Umbelopsis sp. WA50703]